MRSVFVPNKYAGRLPFYLISKIAPKQRAAVTTQTFQFFSEITSELRAIANRACQPFSSYTPGKMDTESAPAVQKLEQYLTETFRLKNVKISAVGHGLISTVYKITTDDNSYAFKVFSTDGYHRFHGHQTNELEHQFLANRKNKSGTTPRVFFGKNGVFVFSEFISPDTTSKYMGPFETACQYIISLDDKPDNRIRGRLVDFGGTIVNDELRDTKTRRLTKEVARALDKNDVKKIKSLKQKYKNTPELKSATKFLDTAAKRIYSYTDAYIRDAPWFYMPANSMRELGIKNYDIHTLHLGIICDIFWEIANYPKNKKAFFADSLSHVYDISVSRLNQECKSKYDRGMYLFGYIYIGLKLGINVSTLKTKYHFTSAELESAIPTLLSDYNMTISQLIALGFSKRSVLKHSSTLPTITRFKQATQMLIKSFLPPTHPSHQNTYE